MTPHEIHLDDEGHALKIKKISYSPLFCVPGKKETECGLEFWNYNWYCAVKNGKWKWSMAFFCKFNHNFTHSIPSHALAWATTNVWWNIVLLCIFQKRNPSKGFRKRAIKKFDSKKCTPKSERRQFVVWMWKLHIFSVAGNISVW